MTSTTLDLPSARRRIRAAVRARARPEWHPPLPGDFRGYTTVLTWDATLHHAGWVLLSRGVAGIHPLGHGTIHLATPQAGYLGTWDLAMQLRPRVAEVLGTRAAHYLAVEAPPVAGHRTESTLIAGLIVWEQSEAEYGDRRRAIAPDHACAVLTGERRQDKKQVKAAVEYWIPSSAGRDWDEHQRDAAAVGLTLLYDLSHGDPVGPRE